MSAPHTTSTVHLPSLAAELPEGWSTSEGATFRAPSGARFDAQLHIAYDESLERLADRVEASWRASIGVADAFDVERSTGSDVVTARRRVHDVDGRREVMRFVVGRRGHGWVVVTGRWVGEPDGRECSEMDALLRGIRVLDHQRITVAAAEGPTLTPLEPSRPRAVDDWQELATEWSALGPVAVTDRAGGERRSPDELAVLAAAIGAPAFPTVGSAWLGALPEGAMAAVVDAVARGFVAHGVLTVDADGAPMVAEPLASLVRTALTADLTIHVLRRTAVGVERHWFGTSASNCVVVRDVGAARELSELPVGLLAAAVFAATGATIHAEGVEADAPTGALAAAHAVVELTTAWRSGTAFEGATDTWFEHNERWAAADRPDDDGSGAEHVPIGTSGVDLWLRLLDRLPGSDVDSVGRR